GSRAGAGLLLGMVKETYLHCHFRENARVEVVDSDAHAQRGLLSIGRRHHAYDLASDNPVRISIEHGLGTLPGANSANESLVDIDLYLTRFHVDYGSDSCAREGAPRRHRRDDLARLCIF